MPIVKPADGRRVSTCCWACCGARYVVLRVLTQHVAHGLVRRVALMARLRGAVITPRPSSSQPPYRDMEVSRLL